MLTIKIKQLNSDSFGHSVLSSCFKVYIVTDTCRTISGVHKNQCTHSYFVCRSGSRVVPWAISVLCNDASLNTAASSLISSPLSCHATMPCTGVPPARLGSRLGKGPNQTFHHAAQAAACTDTLNGVTQRQEWKVWERLWRCCSRNLFPHSLLLCSLSASLAHGTTWALPAQRCAPKPREVAGTGLESNSG